MTENKKPEFKVWFHKFMIYFVLWAFAAFAVLYGVRGITESIENGMPHTALFVIAWGALIALAVYLVKVRFDLAAFRRNALKGLLIAGLVGAGILLLIQGLIYISDEDVYAKDVYAALIVAVWTVGVYRYYKLHSDLFVN